MKKIISFLIFTFVFSMYVFSQTSVWGVRVQQKYKTAVEEMKQKATYIDSLHDEWCVWTDFKAKYLGIDCDVQIARKKHSENVDYICIILPYTSSVTVFMDVYDRFCMLYAADYKKMSSIDDGRHVATTFSSYDGLKIEISGFRPDSPGELGIMIFYYSFYY